ncbi:MAG: SurA N-terminal domain-containing protein [Alphaproteobacteria bacterium]|nr:SurA N-terminal domain-containing protein [Alphaproteobacteria bacterium]
MKYVFLILFLLNALPSLAMELKATVNDTPISDLDVLRWTRLLQFQQPQKYGSMSAKALRQEALDAIIESIIKKQTATEAGFKVSKKDINDAKAHLEQQNNLPPGTLPQLLQKNNVSESALHNQLEADLLWLQYLRSKSGNMSISNLAVNKRYQAMKEELKKQGIDGDNITLWEMAQGLFSEDVDVSTTLGSKSCDAFLEHIKIGPFPDSAKRGWTDPNQMPPELRELLKDVAVGETVGPLRSPTGILVMMKCDIRSQQVMPSKEQLKTQMEMEQLDVLSRRLLAEATRRSIIEKKD